MLELHIISTGQQKKDELIKKLKVVHPYVDYIHLRERSWHVSDYIEVIQQLVAYGVEKEKIIINDRVDIAVTEGINRVQLPSHSLAVEKVKKNFPNLRVGCSIHSVEQALRQEKLGADYLMFGHIFETMSKRHQNGRGLSSLNALCRRVRIPVIAIGGIKPDKIQAIKEQGASGVAILSGILLKEDSLKAVLAYREKINDT